LITSASIVPFCTSLIIKIDIRSLCDQATQHTYPSLIDKCFDDNHDTDETKMKRMMMTTMIETMMIVMMIDISTQNKKIE